MKTMERVSIPTESTAPRRLDALKTAIALGAVTGTWHLGWALLVAAGWAQPLMNWLFELHFIQPVYMIRAFDVGTAALLVLISAIGGFLLGYLFGLFWNLLVDSEAT